MSDMNHPNAAPDSAPDASLRETIERELGLLNRQINALNAETGREFLPVTFDTILDHSLPDPDSRRKRLDSFAVSLADARALLRAVETSQGSPAHDMRGPLSQMHQDYDMLARWHRIALLKERADKEQPDAS